MASIVEQKRAGSSRNRPTKPVLVSLAAGIYSVLAAILSIHLFGFSLFYYIIAVSPIGFASFFVLYFSSTGLRKEGLKKVLTGSFQAMGDVVGRGILTVLYFVVFLIPGVAVSVFGDRLQVKRKPAAWQDRADHEYTLERARDQW